VGGLPNVIEPDQLAGVISLSHGGSDAAIVREFDMATREFVADGFELPEAKTRISWEDEKHRAARHRLRGTGSLTESGYPRLVKRWRRGQPLEEAETVFQRSKPPMSSSRHRLTAHRVSNGTMLGPRHRFPSTTRVYELRAGELIRIDTPTDATVSVHRDWLLIELRTDWYTGSARVCSGLAAGRRLRRIPSRHSTTADRLRTRRAYQPEPLRVGTRDKLVIGHARRCRQPRGGRHPWIVAGPERVPGIPENPTR